MCLKMLLNTYTFSTKKYLILRAEKSKNFIEDANLSQLQKWSVKKFVPELKLPPANEFIPRSLELYPVEENVSFVAMNKLVKRISSLNFSIFPSTLRNRSIRILFIYLQNAKCGSKKTTNFTYLSFGWRSKYSGNIIERSALYSKYYEEGIYWGGEGLYL